MKISNKARRLILAIWQEQLDAGVYVYQASEHPCEAGIEAWAASLGLPAEVYELAADGVDWALAVVRDSAGLEV